MEEMGDKRTPSVLRLQTRKSGSDQLHEDDVT